MKKKTIVLMILVSLVIVTTITAICLIETEECYKGVLIKYPLNPSDNYATYDIVIAESGYAGCTSRGFADISQCRDYIDEKIESGEIGNESLIIDQC